MDTLTLNLDAIEQLFAEPEADPFDPGSRYVSGMDELAAQLQLLSDRELREVNRLVLRLPPPVRDGLRDQVAAAVRRYCDARIAANEQEIAALKREGRATGVTALLIGLLFLGVGVLIAVSPLPDGIKAMAGGAIGIAIWAVLWRPVELYVYDWRPYYRSKRIYETIGEAELILEPRR